MSANYQVKRLIVKHDNLCHYCERPCEKSSKTRYPTRDHIVPRAFGGENSMDNYVLACAECNNNRGTSLFYCECRDCQERILDALYDSDAVKHIFDGIIVHNKPRIRKKDMASAGRAGENEWAVRIGHNQKRFKTWAEALDFALNNTIAKDKDYGSL